MGRAAGGAYLSFDVSPLDLNTFENSEVINEQEADALA